jgi:NAD-dependent deacetylase
MVELHGSLWRLRCPKHGIREDKNEKFYRRRCEHCDSWLRPDITWFGDSLNAAVFSEATAKIERCDLLISIGTSGVVWPAAGLPGLAREAGARCVEINTEETEQSGIYDDHIRMPAAQALPMLF